MLRSGSVSPPGAPPSSGTRWTMYARCASLPSLPQIATKNRTINATAATVIGTKIRVTAMEKSTRNTCYGVAPNSRTPQNIETGRA